MDLINSAFVQLCQTTNFSKLSATTFQTSKSAFVEYIKNILIIIMSEQKKEETSTKGLVVITGASSGIGAECAKEFHKAGHPVLCLARRVDKMKKDLSALKDRIEFNKCDVTNFKEFQDALINAEEKYGPTSCLINNAGVMLLGDMNTQDQSQWNKMINVNINGVLNGMKVVTSTMKKQKSGTIINISSLAGLSISYNITIYSLYTLYNIQDINILIIILYIVQPNMLYELYQKD